MESNNFLLIAIFNLCSKGSVIKQSPTLPRINWYLKVAWKLYKTTGFAIWWSCTRTASSFRPGETGVFVSPSATSPQIGSTGAKTSGKASDVNAVIKVGM